MDDEATVSSFFRGGGGSVASSTRPEKKKGFFRKVLANAAIATRRLASNDSVAGDSVAGDAPLATGFGVAGEDYEWDLRSVGSVPQRYHEDTREYAQNDANNDRFAPAPRVVVTHEGVLDVSQLPRKEGWLYKKGGAVNARGGFRNWKRRWFVLTPIDFFGSEGWELRYYDSENGTMKGSIALTDVAVTAESWSEHKKVKFEFQLTLQAGGVLQLSSDEEFERREWMESLTTVISYMQKLVASTNAIGGGAGAPAAARVMTVDGYDPWFDDEPDNFALGEDLAQNCQAFGPGLFGAEAGQASQFVVQVCDLMGQQVVRGGMPISATLNGEGCMYHIAVIDNGDGTYYAHYTVGRAGRYTLSIRCNGVHHIFGSPYEIEVLPSRTLPKFCIARGEALSRVVNRSVSSFVIEARDGFGNRKQRGGDPFEVGIMGPAQLLELRDCGDGTYECTLETGQPGSGNSALLGGGASSSLMILVTLYGKPIAGSPFKPVLVSNSTSSIPQQDNVDKLPTPTISPSPRNTSPGRTSGALQRRSMLDNTEFSAPTSPAQRSTTPSATSEVSRTPSSLLSPAAVRSQMPASARQLTSSAASAINEPTIRTSISQMPRPPLPSSSEAPTAVQPPQPSTSPRNLPLPDSALSMAAPPPSVPQTKTVPPLQHNVAESVPVVPPVSPTQSLSTTSPAIYQQQYHQQHLGEHPIGQQQQKMTTTSSTPSAGLSRLERSRQRAMLAKSMSAGAPGAVPIAPPLPSSPQYQNQSPTSHGASSPTPAMNVTSPVANTASGSKLSQLAQRSAATLARKKETEIASPQPSSEPVVNHTANPQYTNPYGSPPPVQPVSTSTNGFSPAALQALSANLSAGLGSVQPSCTPYELSVWEATADALADPSVVEILCSAAETLGQLFALFCDRVDGVSVVRLVSPRGYGGLLRLLEVYEVCPAYVSRGEARALFSQATLAQQTLRSPAAVAGQGAGLEFSFFVKWLALVAIAALSKSESLATHYPNSASKISALLFQWGLGDPHRLRAVRTALSENGDAGH